MTNRLEPRIRRLEAAAREADDDRLFDGLTFKQMHAFKIMLEAEADWRLFGDPAGDRVNDEYLWQNAMSRETYDAALASITQAWWGRLQAWCLSRRRETEAGTI